MPDKNKKYRKKVDSVKKYWSPEDLEFINEIKNTKYRNTSFNFTDAQYQELGLGSWIKDNAGTLSKVAGVAAPLANLIPGAGPFISAGLGAASSTLGEMDANAQAEQGADNMAIQNSINRQQQQIKAEGGFINYDEGQKHSEPTGGIPVDKQGNPVANTQNTPVAKVEKGEVSWVTPDGQSYVFSEQLGYAKEAKKIQSKYKMRLGKDLQGNDPLARGAMTKELNNLMIKQEAERMKDNSNELAGGGWVNALNDTLSNVPKTSGINMNAFNSQTRYGDNTIGVYNSPTIKQQGNKILPESPTAYDPYQESLPWIAGQAGATALGNAALASMSKTKHINPSKVQPNEINLQGQRDFAASEAAIGKAGALRNAREVGTSRGAYLSNAAAVTTGMNKNLNNAVGQSYLQEESINAESRGRADMFNAQSADRASQFNAYRDDQALERKLDYLRGAISGIQGAGADLQKARQSRDFLNVYSTRTGYQMVRDPYTKQLKMQAIPDFFQKWEPK